MSTKVKDIPLPRNWRDVIARLTNMHYCDKQCGCSENSKLWYFPTGTASLKVPHWLPGKMNGIDTHSLWRWLVQHNRHVLEGRRVPGPYFVWEPEWADGYTHVDNIIIAKTRKGDINQEVLSINADSSFFDHRRVPIRSGLRNDATVHPDALATAEFVAKACNSHDDLVHLVSDLLDQIEDVRFRNWPLNTRKKLGLDPEKLDAFLRRGESVLRKAKFKKPKKEKAAK